MQNENSYQISSYSVRRDIRVEDFKKSTEKSIKRKGGESLPTFQLKGGEKMKRALIIVVLIVLAAWYLVKTDQDVAKIEQQAIEHARECMKSNYENPGCR